MTSVRPRQVMVHQWQTAVMPGPAFYYSHPECLVASSPELAGIVIRALQVSEMITIPHKTTSTEMFRSLFVGECHASECVYCHGPLGVAPHQDHLDHLEEK